MANRKLLLRILVPVMVLQLLLTVGPILYATWTAPRTWVSGEIVTAAQLNTHVRDNLTELRAGGLALSSQATDDLMMASSSSQWVRTRTPKADGIQFAATQVASADANMLDDYEEGNWTPVIGGTGGTSGQSYTTQVGRYTKIGKRVFFNGYAVLSNKGTITTGVQIQGLPFTSEGTLQGQTCPVWFNTLATSWVSLMGYVDPSSTVVEVVGSQSAGTSLAQPTTTDIANTTSIMVSCSYNATN